MEKFEKFLPPQEKTLQKEGEKTKEKIQRQTLEEEAERARKLLEKEIKEKVSPEDIEESVKAGREREEQEK